MNRVNILSMQRVDNYGSLLQAYGLKKTLEKLDASVSFIDIRRNEMDDVIMKQHAENFSFDKEVGGRGLRIEKIDRYLARRVKRKLLHFGEEQIQQFQRFRIDNLEIEKRENEDCLCVIGSDEVFSCQQGAPWGFTSQLFGNVPNAKRIITYAASCGPTRYEYLPIQIIEIIRDAMNNLSDISVRDRNTLEFVKKVNPRLEFDIKENLDPALQYDFRDELNTIKLPNIPSEDYCLIYAYKNRIMKRNEVEAILSFCKEKGLHPITVGGPQLWCKHHIVCTPFQCLKLFQNAKFVITDTFHGTIFSIKFAKSFAVIIRESNKNKITDLVKKMKIDAHVLEDLNKLEVIYKIEKDEELVERILKEERDKTEYYLASYL